MNNSNDITLDEIFLGGKINNSNNLSSKGNGEEKFPKLDKPSGASDQIISYIDRPVMDTSLPYIPVYTHLITFDLERIERPPTPPVIKFLRSELRTDTPRGSPESRGSSKLGKANHK